MKTPRGKPKSGRVWKSEKKRFTSMNQVKPLKSSWEAKTKQRYERKCLKAIEDEIKSATQKQIEERKKRREEKRKRKEENERKSEVVQVVRNTAKLKRLKKKQLKYIRKADTN